jgi:hypothetical protein
MNATAPAPALRLAGSSKKVENLATPKKTPATREIAKVAPTIIGKGLTPPEHRSLIWSVKDKWSDVEAHRIFAPNGDPTSFMMVYGHNKDGDLMPIRPVSDRYHPIKTNDILDIATTRLADVIDSTAIKTRTDRFGSSVDLWLPFKNQIVISKGQPYDTGTNAVVNGAKTTSDIVRPSIRIRNAYDGTSSVRIQFGFIRMVCSNGLFLMTGGIQSKAIHTIHEVKRVITELGQADWSGAEDQLAALPKAKVKDEQLERILAMIPKKYQEEMAEHVKLGGNTAWAAANYISYLQSHVFSLNRGAQLDKPMAAIVKLAA